MAESFAPNEEIIASKHSPNGLGNVGMCVFSMRPGPVGSIELHTAADDGGARKNAVEHTHQNDQQLLLVVLRSSKSFVRWPQSGAALGWARAYPEITNLPLTR